MRRIAVACMVMTAAAGVLVAAASGRAAICTPGVGPSIRLSLGGTTGGGPWDLVAEYDAKYFNAAGKVNKGDQSPEFCVVAGDWFAPPGGTTRLPNSLYGPSTQYVPCGDSEEYVATMRDTFGFFFKNYTVGFWVAAFAPSSVVGSPPDCDMSNTVNQIEVESTLQ